jgi:putative SOS response-associated peptidase YedK
MAVIPKQLPSPVSQGFFFAESENLRLLGRRGKFILSFAIVCGRYTLINLAELTDLFPWIHGTPPDEAARYNIAPSQPILAVANDHPDRYDHFLWGLIPPWAKDSSIGNKMCNARGETIAEKSAFRNAYKRRRCLIPADGFYEWKLQPDGKSKQPMYIRMKSGKPFALAGLWETWQDDRGSEIRSATIITTRPNALVAMMHDRMPLILKPADFERWLAKSEVKPGELDHLIAPFGGEAMEAYPISRQVNSPRNEGPELIERVEPERTTLFG